MKFEHLKVFHRVALTGSFTKAARSLNLSQPAVSQQIQLLEHSLGIMLFDRQGKKSDSQTRVKPSYPTPTGFLTSMKKSRTFLNHNIV